MDALPETVAGQWPGTNMMGHLLMAIRTIAAQSPDRLEIARLPFVDENSSGLKELANDIVALPIRIRAPPVEPVRSQSTNPAKQPEEVSSITLETPTTGANAIPLARFSSSVLCSAVQPTATNAQEFVSITIDHDLPPVQTLCSRSGGEVKATER